MLAVAAALAAASVALHAQTGIATATLQGAVSSLSGEPLLGATVTATNLETGLSRTQPTDHRGRFQIRLLPPGEYSVKAELEGFTPVERQGLQLRIGEAPSVSFRLELATVADLLVVTGEAPLIETTRSSAVDTIDPRSIESLPSNGRDFKDLMILVPQVSESAGRPTVGGGEGMMNSFNVDGADSNSLFSGEQLGGNLTPFTYSRAAIREFQVLRSSYNVRFGGAAGGIVNAVTRSGTNSLQGSLFAFFQDTGMVAADALGAERDDFERRQIGFNIGGPLRLDELHAFLAYDSQRRDQNALRRPVGLAAELLPAFNARLVSLGIDPGAEFDYVITNDADVYLARLDWTLDEHHRLWLRHNLSDQGGDNITFAFPGSGRSNLGRGESRFSSSVLGLTSMLGSRSFNEAIAQYAPAKRPRVANVTSVPQTVIGLFSAVVGQGLTLPSHLNEDRLQLQDHLNLQRGDHSLRFGLDYSNLEFDNSFQLSRGGSYYLPSYEEFLEEAPCTALAPGEAPCLYVEAFSPVDGLVRFDTHLLSIYAGDQWRLLPRLTLEYGLRVEHQENPPAQNPNPLAPQTARIPDDTNLAPRAGFAWDLKGDGRSVLRGGVGIFFSWSPSLLVANAILGNGVNGFAVILVQGLSPTFPEYPDRLAPEVVGQGRAPPNIFLFSSDFENPETRRFSLGYEKAAGDRLRLGAEITYSESRHRVRQRDVNLNPAPVAYAADGRPVYGGAGARLDPTFAQMLQFTSDAEAEYFSVVLSARESFGRSWSLQADYTYSESRDHDSSETENTTTVAEDHYYLDQDWGWSSSDVRHRLVVSCVFTTTYGLTFSFLGSYRGAYPINALAGSDLNNDGFFGDRPGPDPDLDLETHLPRNGFRGSSAATVDLRVARAFGFAPGHEIEVMLEVFNLTNEPNYAVFDTDYVRFGRPNPEFGEPLQAGQPRAMQVGLRYRF